jgi:hypothetical protein
MLKSNAQSIRSGPGRRGRSGVSSRAFRALLIGVRLLLTAITAVLLMGEIVIGAWSSVDLAFLLERGDFPLASYILGVLAVIVLAATIEAAFIRRLWQFTDRALRRDRA